MGLASFLNLEADQRRKREQAEALAAATGVKPEAPAPPKAKPEAPKANPRPAAKSAAKNATEPVRARNADGSYKADDPATPDVNEAYEPRTAAKKPAKS